MSVDVYVSLSSTTPDARPLIVGFNPGRGIPTTLPQLTLPAPLAPTSPVTQPTVYAYIGTFEVLNVATSSHETTRPTSIYLAHPTPHGKTTQTAFWSWVGIAGLTLLLIVVDSLGKDALKTSERAFDSAAGTLQDCREKRVAMSPPFTPHDVERELLCLALLNMHNTASELTLDVTMLVVVFSFPLLILVMYKGIVMMLPPPPPAPTYLVVDAGEL